MTAIRPFADAMPFYRLAGWSGTLPLPPGAKHNPPDGWTGGHNRDPDDATVAYWAANGQASGNIALRLPVGVIGLDVDAYDAWRPWIDPATGQTTRRLVHKRGAETLAELEAALGPLPPTWISSARPAPSGIRLFRIPPGTEITESALPGDIEVIRRGHRYMVAPPSINPETGTAYAWWTGSSTTSWQRQQRPPKHEEIPFAPAAWLVRLSSRPAPSSGVAINPFFQQAKTEDTARRQWDRLADRFVGFVRRCELFGWGGDAHAQLLELTREAAQLAPAHAHRAVGEWFAAGGAGWVDSRVWAMLDSALGKYPADKIVAGHGDSSTEAQPATMGSHANGASGVQSTSDRTHVGGDAASLPQQNTPDGSGATSAAPHSLAQPIGGVVSAGHISEATSIALTNGVPGAGMSPGAGAGTDSRSQHSPAAGTTDGSIARPRRLPMIPDPVWDAYGWTRSIRAQARAADVCPDAVLGAMLAAYASRIPAGVRVVTGTKMPLGTNLVVSLVGPSGSDKSTAFNLATRIMPGSAVPIVNNPGSGEAFAATFTHPDPDSDLPVGKRPKVLKPDPRALFYVSEGALLGSIGARLGSTWLSHLRALAVDESLSTTNATSEINRQVPAQSYSAGVVVGFQVTTAMPILNDTHTGTAQRFLWFTSLSTEDFAPGTGVDAPDVPMATPVVTRLGAGIDETNQPIHYLTVAQAITDRIKAQQRHQRLTRDVAASDDHDAHRHTLVAKLAAIAVLADDRVFIEERDWAWAESLADASAAVRDELLDLAQDRARHERAEMGQRQAESDRARRGFDGDEARVAQVMLARLDRVGRSSRRDLVKSTDSRDRRLASGALDQLESAGWVVRDANGLFYRASQTTGQ